MFPESSEDGGYENPLQHNDVVDTTQFCEAARELLTKLENDLEPMKAKNDTFVVEMSLIHI